MSNVVVLLGCIVFCVAFAVLFGFAFTAAGVALLERKNPPKGAFLRTSAGVLHYTELLPSGPAKGVVALLHGASANQADLMIPLGARLARRGFRVVAVDRPGLGWSERREREAALGRQSSLLAKALGDVAQEPVVLVAHSLAGAIAVRMAAENPYLVRGLVLIGPVTHPWSGGVAWHYRLAAARWVGWWFAHVASFPLGLLVIPSALKSVFSPATTPAGYARRTQARLALTPLRFRANARDVVALHAEVRDLPAMFERIDAPTVVIAGGRDQVVSARQQSAVAAEAIRGAELAILPDVGHSPHWTRPEAVVDAIEWVWTAGQGAPQRAERKPARVRV